MSDTPAPRKRGNPNWKPGISGNPTGKRRTDTAPPETDMPVSQALRGDGWQNGSTGVGLSSRDKRLGTSFVGSAGITWPEAMAMWREDDLAARVIETPPNEMLRQGWCAKLDDQDREDAVRSKCEELGVDAKLALALCYERAYGGGALFLGIRDGRALSEPVNEAAIRGLDWITTIEPRELTPVGFYADPKAPRFGDVAIWRYTPTLPGPSAYGMTAVVQTSIDIHESRLVIFPGIKVSSLQISQAFGWGAPVLDRVAPVLRDFASAWAGAGLLAADFAPPVFKMKGLAEAVSSDKGQVLRARIAGLELARGMARVNLVDISEEFKRETVNISGLPELLDKFASRFAAAADMPLTLLMGISPGGLNATGDSDVRFFYDRMKSAQKNKLQPALERIVKIVLLSTGTEPDHWSIEFNPLWQPSDKEVADTRLVHAQTDALGCQWGWLSPEDVRKGRHQGDDYGNDLRVEGDLPEEPEPDPADLPPPGGDEVPPPDDEEQNTDTSAQVSAKRADEQSREENGQFGEGGGGSSGGGASEARAAYDRATKEEEGAADEHAQAEDEHDQDRAELRDLKSDLKRAEHSKDEEGVAEARRAIAEVETRAAASKERARAAKERKRAASRAVDRASDALGVAEGSLTPEDVAADVER